MRSPFPVLEIIISKLGKPLENIWLINDNPPEERSDCFADKNGMTLEDKERIAN